MTQLERELRASVAWATERNRQQGRKQMEQGIIKHENGTAGMVAAPFLEFSDEQRQLIRDTYANGATDSEFAVLLEVARARKLNPFTRQIHFVKRKDKEKSRDVWSAQASIDGLRAIAQRTGLYDGQDEPEFEYDDKGKLIKATVRVYRKDWRRPAVGVAHFEEYKQTKYDGGLNTFWATKSHIMLSKCAESVALRKAFPEDMSGLYSPEEMGNMPEPVEQELPRISPHGEPEDGVVYHEAPVADMLVASLEESETLLGLHAVWEASGANTVDGYEAFHPQDRKRISTAFKRRERQLSKPAKDLDKAAAAAASEDL
jgi:phage recombination protein Bet